ncbi:hypothetical protein ACFLT7_07595, partial [candidate division KSB1 bacterium]
SMDDFTADPNDAKRCFFYDEESKKLYLKTGKKDSPSAHKVLFSQFAEGFQFDGASYVVVKDFEIRNYGDAGIALDGNSDNNIIIGNHIHHAPQGIGIHSEWADDNHICFNHIWDEGLGDFTWRAVKASNYPRGGINCSGGRGNSMVGNDIHGWFDCITAGAWGRLEECHINRDVEIMFNDLYNAGDDALEPEGCHINLRIHGNRIRNVLTAISLAPIGTGPAYITYNDCTYYLLLYKMNVGGCWSGGYCYSYHNTGFPIVPDKGTGLSFSYGIPLKNKIFRNNIMATGQRLVRSGPAGNSADYTCYFLTDDKDTVPFEWERQIYQTLAEFRQATGNESHGMVADPRIVALPKRDGIVFDDYGLFHLDQNPPLENVDIGDLRLQAGSPCIDTGLLIRGINENFSGKAPDIGTYERGVEMKYGTAHFQK